MKDGVIVLGGGGHAKVVMDCLLLQGIKILGVTDQKKVHVSLAGATIPYLGQDEAIRDYDAKQVWLVNGIASTGVPAFRRTLFESWKVKGFRFLSVIHPSAIIASSVKMGEGVQIMAGAVIQADAAIGDNVIVNTQASIDHDCVLESHCHIAPGVVLSGGVRVGEESHIGTGAAVIQSINIGRRCFVRAGSCVVRDVSE